MEGKGKILVTGFGVFDEYEVNPSWESVKLLPSMGCGAKQGLETVIEEVPVDYDFVQREIPRRWAKYNPKLVLHVGVSKYASDPTLELLAHNDGYVTEDINGKTPPGNVCVEGGELVLRTDIDMGKVKAKLEKSDCNSCISDDPGRFLCDFTYYTSLHEDRSRTAFVHVPPLDKPYTAQQLAEKLMLIIDLFLEQLGFN